MSVLLNGHVISGKQSQNNYLKVIKCGDPVSKHSTFSKPHPKGGNSILIME